MSIVASLGSPGVLAVGASLAVANRLDRSSIRQRKANEKGGNGQSGTRS
jgi:hypothetical protein